MISDQEQLKELELIEWIESMSNDYHNKMTTYKEAYEEFIDKLSEIERHYDSDESQNIHFSIAIQDEYDKFWKMKREEGSVNE